MTDLYRLEEGKALEADLPKSVAQDHSSYLENLAAVEGDRMYAHARQAQAITQRGRRQRKISTRTALSRN